MTDNILKEKEEFVITPELEKELWQNFNDAAEALVKFKLTDLEINAIILSYFKDENKFPLIVEGYKKDEKISRGLNSVGSIIELTAEDYDFQVKKNNRRYNFSLARSKIIKVFGNRRLSFYTRMNDLRDNSIYISSKQKQSPIDNLRLKINKVRFQNNEYIVQKILDKKIQIGLEMMARLKFPSYLEKQKKDAEKNQMPMIENLLSKELIKVIREIKMLSHILKIDEEAEIKVQSIIAKYDQEVKGNFADPEVKLYLNPDFGTSLHNMFLEIDKYYRELLDEKAKLDEVNKPIQIMQKIKAETQKKVVIDNTIKELREMSVELGQEDRMEERLKPIIERLNNDNKLDDNLAELFDLFYQTQIKYNEFKNQQSQIDGFNELKREADAISKKI